MKSSKIVLQDAYKGYTLDQDKFLPPEETVQRLKNTLQELKLTILESTARIDNGRLGVPVFFSRCGADARRVIGTRKQMGKGATPAQAEASAVMELAERYSFFSFAQEPANFRIATYPEVQNRAVSFETIARSVHDRSADLDIAAEIFENVPLKWTGAYDLQRQLEILVPFDWFFTINAFNGPSAGNCPEEALVQGLCEIVERHVSCIISQERRSVPLIRPESVKDPVALEMMGRFHDAGVDLWLSDFTLDTGVASVGALAFDPATFPAQSEIVWTAGTHPDPDKALVRALTEVAQLAGDFNTGANYMASGLPKFKSIEAAAYITNPGGSVAMGDMPRIADANFKTEVENVVAALQSGGFDALAIDITHPLLKVPAFYAIVPGARFRERAASPGVAMFLAKLIVENHSPAQAAEKVAAMQRRLPDRYYLNFYQALCQMELNAPDDALPFLEHALKLSPAEQDIPSIYSYMGVCLKELGRFGEAIDRLDEGIRFDPERTDLYNLKGFCHFALKEHEEAIACFQKVIALNPGSAIDYANIASNYRDMGNVDEAIRYYEMALNLDPTIDFALENYLRLQSQKGGDQG